MERGKYMNYNKKVRYCYELSAALFGIHYLNRSHGNFTRENILTHSVLGKDHIKAVGVKFDDLTEDLRRQDYLNLCYLMSILFSQDETNMKENSESLKEKILKNLNLNSETPIPLGLKNSILEIINQSSYEKCLLTPLIYQLATMSEYLDNLIVFPYCPQNKLGKEAILLSEDDHLGNSFALINKSSTDEGQNIIQSMQIVDRNKISKLFGGILKNKISNDFSSTVDPDKFNAEFFNCKLKKIELMTSSNAVVCVKFTTDKDEEILIGTLPKNEFVLHCISGNFYYIRGVVIRHEEQINSLQFYLKIVA